jgi:DNA-directed RNA polymerase subunit RPC12/RpoP
MEKNRDSPGPSEVVEVSAVLGGRRFVIRFCCEHCGHKIAVEDTHIGKRGKCPACGTIVTVPTESTLTEFSCKDCGRRLTAPKIQAGRKVVCPQCENVIIVPAEGQTSAVSIGIVRFPCSTCHREIEEPETSRGKLVECPHCRNYVAVPSAQTPAQEIEIPVPPPAQNDTSDEQLEQMQKDQGRVTLQEPKPVAERKLPWILDTFLYPVSLSGITHLAIFTIIPSLIAILRTSLGKASMIVGLPSSIINILIFLYMGWYFTECVRDSAKGGTRAPEAFASMGAGEMWSQIQHIVGCYLILISPAFFYDLYTGKLDAVYWGLLIIGSFFFPMGLLACIMFDSIRGLNPKLLIGSMFSTFFQYCGLVLLVIAIIFIFTQLVGMVVTGAPKKPSAAMLVLGGAIFFTGLYVAFVIAHIIGRFYWRNQEKLNWEV